MHIGFVTSEYPTTKKPEGGLGTYIRKVGLELIQRGHVVTVFILSSKQHLGVDQGIRLHFIKRMKFHWRFHQITALHHWLDLEEQRINARRLKNAVLARNKQEHIDILQTPNYKALGSYLNHNKFFPIVCRCSSYQPLWRSANGYRRKFTDIIFDWLEAKQVIEADAAISPSEFIAQTYQRFEAIKPTVVRTPVDLNSISQDISIYSNYMEGKKYLLYFGTLNGVKGVDVLIHAIPSILSTNDELSVVLIGRDDPLPDGIKAGKMLQTHCEKYFEENRVIYLPPLPKSQLYPIIEHALCVIMPSRVDNYPNACLEALALGIPVIGTYDSSLDEIIEDGKTGFLAKNDDLTSLKEAINHLLRQSSQERADMIGNIHQKVCEIRKEDRTGALIRFYQEIVAKYRKNP